MKKTLIISIFIFSIQMLCAQSCETYRIKYLVKIKSDSVKVKAIKFPTITYLHGLNEKDGIQSIRKEVKVENGNVECFDFSYQIGDYSKEAKSLFLFYKSKRENLPLRIIVTSSLGEKEILKKIDWDKIKITKTENRSPGNSFQLNFEEIKI